MGHRREHEFRTRLVKSFMEVSLEIFDFFAAHMTQHIVRAKHQAARVKMEFVLRCGAILAQHDAIVF